jgi:hypothetical protein
LIEQPRAVKNIRRPCCGDIKENSALRIEAKLPAALWSEVLKALVYIINRLPRRMLNWETPITILYRKIGQEYKPNLVNLKVLGSKAYVRRINVPKS